MIVTVVCLWLLGAAMFAVDAFAEPLPGDVYREYTWRPEGKCQRVTGPNVEDERTKAFLPNAVNRIVIDDLRLARRVEARICWSPLGISRRSRGKGAERCDMLKHNLPCDMLKHNLRSFGSRHITRPRRDRR